jgi:hypothetical protein
VFLRNYQSTSRAKFQYDPLLAVGMPRVACRCHVIRPIRAPLGSFLAAALPTSAFERSRIFPTFGATAFSSYRQKKISCENECVRAPSDRGHMTQGTFIRRPARLQISCPRASNRQCKAWKTFKASHVCNATCFSLLPDVGNAYLINALDSPNSGEQKCIGR